MKSKRHSYLLMFGHICTDINQGALPAMLPFLIATYGLSYASAAALVLASSIVSSVIQPLFGHLGDRLDRPWFMSLGIVLAGFGIALIGYVHEYWLMFACAMLSGIGVALFHPEGGKLANCVAGASKGAGISNFAVGGNLGFATGPVIAAAALSVWGIGGTAIFIVPAVVMAGILLTQNRRYQQFSQQEQERKAVANGGQQTDDWPGFFKVTSVNVVRSIAGNGLIVFIPLYWIAVLGQSQELSSLMITVHSGVGAVATFFGGRLADRFGFRRIIVVSYCLLGPLMLAFIFTSNIIIATLLVVLVSMSVSIVYSPVIALGQGYLPNRLGLASGISLGVVVSFGGITSPLIGLAGDHYGLPVSMAIICAVAFLGAPAAVLAATHRSKTGQNRPNAD